LFVKLFDFKSILPHIPAVNQPYWIPAVNQPYLILAVNQPYWIPEVNQPYWIRGKTIKYQYHHK
jgi:hypothetical protein